MQTIFTDPQVSQRARAARWSKGARVLSLLLAVWFSCVVAVLLLPHNYPGIRALFVPVLSILVGIPFIILFLIALRLGQNKVVSLAGLGLTLVVGVGLVSRGIAWGAAGNFYLNQSHYESTVNKVKTADSEAARIKACGDDCFILSSDPLRVSFHYWHGYLNWKDIVYDPSGEINVADWARRKKLDLYLVGASPLTGDWYLAHFGD